MILCVISGDRARYLMGAAEAAGGWVCTEADIQMEADIQVGLARMPTAWSAWHLALLPAHMKSREDITVSEVHRASLIERFRYRANPESRVETGGSDTGRVSTRRMK